MWNEKTSFNPLPGKAVKERGNFETYELFIYGDLHLITNSLCKNVLRKATPWLRLRITFVHKISYLSAVYISY